MKNADPSNYTISEDKCCRVCQKTKPLTEYYQVKHKPGATYTKCKSCVSSTAVAYGKTKEGKAVRAKATKKYVNTPKGKDVIRAAVDRKLKRLRDETVIRKAKKKAAKLAGDI